MENGEEFEGVSFGAEKNVSGEVVFNTGMVGYPETLTDPSYEGEILVLTYPLVGNYGVPWEVKSGKLKVKSYFESDKIHIRGLVVADYSKDFSHWQAEKSLGQWLKDEGIPAITGVDTRKLTKILREKGTMLGKLQIANCKLQIANFLDPNQENLAAKVSCKKPIIYRGGRKRIVLVDCGMKNNILRCLLKRGLTVIRVPWDYDFFQYKFDGILVSNGPGDPKKCAATIEHVRRALKKNTPTFGICLGNQILALAAGADTYKLKYGHRSQNQPCLQAGTKRSYLTSQNHGYAVDAKTLPWGWTPWFVNANDGTNEGIRHKTKPFMSVQFHPEATPGPTDTEWLFDEFLKRL